VVAGRTADASQQGHAENTGSHGHSEEAKSEEQACAGSESQVGGGWGTKNYDEGREIQLALPLWYRREACEDGSEV
jgi:hypothetical protein